MVAYVDIIVLLNWGFDSLLLYWTSLLLKRRVPYYRIFAGGLIGALLIVFTFSPYYAIANLVIIKLAVSVLMVWMGFGYKRWKVFVKALFLFYFVTFLSGGILLGVHYLFSYKFLAAEPSVFYMPKSYGDPVSWLFVMLGFPLGWVYAKKVFSEMEMTNIMQESMMDVQMCVKGKLLECRGFIDTGNQLYEPITNIPVMVASAIALKDQLPEEVYRLIRNGGKMEEWGADFQVVWADRIRFIPYKVVGKEQQLLVAFRPDWIKLSSGDSSGTINKGLVAFTEQTLSHDGSFDCIIHPRMLISMKGAS
ncbi:sigma-E processing peptidase SpoIIGA [Bacillus sp. 1P06AnD]|uniref:sigma-E processing peptidase SpoIIGA n=1 Tax=Bacillus sp. 1P06AnD TaxID=3132208 RepID=UPI0039A2C872